MIYSTNYMDLAGKISPIAFSKYLKETGWTLFQSKKTNLKIYQFETERDFYQINIPMSKSLSDYKRAMYNAVETVAEVEKKSLEQVMLYLLNPNTDILKIRLDREDVENGSIFFDDAIRLYDNAKKLLAATALDVLHPRKYHQGRMDDAVQQFLSSCRFGQTEIGSYVISVACPFAELNDEEGYQQLSIFSDEVQCANSLTRKITSRVMENICYIKRVIDEGEIQSLLKNEETIISANFYEALAGLNLETEGVNVEFIAEWSPIVKNNKHIQQRILLTHDYYQPLEATIGKLKERKNASTKILGRISKLESLPDVDKRTDGKISVVYLDENEKKKTATIQLKKSDYDKAILAHKKGLHVEIIGEMNIGTKTTMTCEAFSIIE